MWELDYKESYEWSRSVVSDSLWPHGLQHARPPCPLPTRSLLELMSIESMVPSIHLILCYPLLRLPSIFPSIRALESLLVSWFFASGGKKYCSFSISISPFNENPELVSLRIDWFDLFAVQMTLKSLLQLHSLKASIQPSLWSNPHVCTRLLKKP